MLIPSIHKVGVFVDSANIYRNGGHRLQYDVLREFALRDAGQLMRLNAYVTLDTERAGDDPEYRSKTQGFFSAPRDFGYKVNIKEVKWFTDKRKNPDSPYESAFFHFSRLENGGLSGKLPNRELIFEFNLVPSDRKADEYTADAINLV